MRIQLLISLSNVGKFINIDPSQLDMIEKTAVGKPLLCDDKEVGRIISARILEDKTSVEFTAELDVMGSVYL